MPESLAEIAARIAKRNSARAEATLQADIRAFILTAGLNLTGDEVVDVGQDVAMEAQVGGGTRYRIDVEVGHTVIEVKKDLTIGTVLADGTKQLGLYLHHRVQQTGGRYLGVLTDGRQWLLFVPDPDNAGEVIQAGDDLVVGSAADTEKLRYWLGTILATVSQVKPTAEAIANHLGAGSPTHAANHATLAALLEAGESRPEVKVKRELWARLLRTAFGSAFEDDTAMFVDHTLLVITSEIIAHAVLGYDVSKIGPLSPRQLTDGSEFANSQIFGAVEADFFDWPLELEGGEEFVRSLGERLSRFDWENVEHDVLKHLYESVISQTSRQSLGEYYTPDWLAERVVADAVTDPLNQRVLDPACGSGTFVFHAVRAYLAAADDAGVANGDAVEGVLEHVAGMDIHPVAATLARVTYLLAIGRERLAAPDRKAMSVPVYLGDSLQWEQQRDLFAGVDTVRVHTAGDELVEGAGGTLLEDDLEFPASLVADASRFDRIVREMADAALDVSGTFARTLMNPILARAKVVDPDEVRVLTATFVRMRELHRLGRNHIWGYYVRNLVRPIWLAEPENRADVLVGNPPWLRYSKMTPAMQERYRALAKERNLLSGPLGASARDLSTLFVARAVELYLKEPGRFSFVMPWGTLTRRPHDGFRSGRWSLDKHSGERVRVTFDQAWDLLGAAKATGFPMVSCVVRGRRSRSRQQPLLGSVQAWSVQAARADAPWSEIGPKMKYQELVRRQLGPGDSDPESPYKAKFRSGAIIYPRVLTFVERVDAGPLGAGAGRTVIRTRASTQKPWSSVEPLSGAVESEFIHPVYVGASVLPFRVLSPLLAALPINTTHPNRLMTDAEIRAVDGFGKWWIKVEELWEEHRRKDEAQPLAERIDYSSQLSSQLPINPASQRVLYTASGSNLAAARVSDDSALIENGLYWAAPASEPEANFLTAILNSTTLKVRVAPLQAVGLFGPRHFHKAVFAVPFEGFNPADKAHLDLVTIAEECEAAAAAVDIASARTFQQARALIWGALGAQGLVSRLDRAVDLVLPQAI